MSVLESLKNIQAEAMEQLQGAGAAEELDRWRPLGGVPA